MSLLNYEITLYHTPYIDNLVAELQSIIRKKKSLYKDVKSESDYHKKLSFEERQFIKHLSNEEDKILLQLIEHKGWKVETTGRTQIESFTNRIHEN